MPASLSDTRVIDPILSTVARGYRNATLASEVLFPIVNVPQRAGKIIQFGAEAFAAQALERAPGAERQRLSTAYASGEYALTQRALDGEVSRERLEEGRAVPGIDLAQQAARAAMRLILLQIELAAAALATTAAKYASGNKATLSGASQWSHKDSTPAAAVEAAKQAVANAVGVDPNTLVIGPQVFSALINNPDVVDRIKYTAGPGRGATVTSQTLAAYFNVEQVVVARARKGKPGAFAPIWGKHAILAYTRTSNLPQAVMDAGEPSYGYTYRLNNYPIVEPGWFDKSCDTWRYPVTSEDTPVIAGANAGYLFSAVVA